MSRDPYEVLGISPSASDGEVKTAYRNLARKYHPDNYANNPLSDLAQEKMQEINDAYDTIVRMRQDGGRTGNGGYSHPGGYSHAGSSQNVDVRRLISQNRILEAETLLDGTPSSGRDAEWYFLKGNVLYRKGWLDEAHFHFETACRMDPRNMEYRQVYNQVSTGRQTGGFRTQNNAGGGCDGCDVCTTLWCADCCCECMGGDLIRCC